MEVALDKLWSSMGAAGAIAALGIYAVVRLYRDLRRDIKDAHAERDAQSAAKDAQGAAYLAMFSELSTDNVVAIKELGATLATLKDTLGRIEQRLGNLESRRKG